MNKRVSEENLKKYVYILNTCAQYVLKKCPTNEMDNSSSISDFGILDHLILIHV